MKSKLKGAQTGHDLLKRKSEALTKYALTVCSTFPKLR
jgi:vacuolar-type H+-ATPase subunit D/Vma8